MKAVASYVKRWNEEWILSLFESAMTAVEVANALDQQMCFVLETIPFTEFVR